MNSRQTSAFLLGLVLASSGVMCLGAPKASATLVYIFTEDFDGDWPPKFYEIEPVVGSWKVTDNNPASWYDFWGRSAVRSNSGSYSAWCAQNGYNSLNSLANTVNGYYDQNMSACMMVYLGNLEGYESVTLTFSYWAESGITAVNDYLEVRAFTGSAWVDLWKQPNVGNKTWESRVMGVPTSAEWVAFYFFSDSLVGLGPYEGVYVDDIVVYGNDIDQPSSMAGPLDPYMSGEMVYVPYTASDAFGSGVEFVELYFRNESMTAFSRYEPPDNPEGQWTDGIIPFNATLFEGEGLYEFYTVATDHALNVEPAPGAADTYTTMDNTPPVTELVMGSDPSSGDWYDDDVELLLWADDDRSGVEDTWYKVGDGDWELYASGVSVESEGLFEVRYYSVDAAGNNEQVHVLELGVDMTAPDLDVLSPVSGSSLSVGDLTVSWECSDEISGIHHLVVTIDDTLSEYCNSTTTEILISGIDPGAHNVTVTAYDEAGNWAEVTMSFQVEGEEEPADTEDEPPSDWMLWALLAASIVIFLMSLVAALRSMRAKRGA